MHSLRAMPGQQEMEANREQHFQPTSNQFAHEQAASVNRSQWASVNRGHPGVPAMGTINDRRYNQQQRIAQGIRSEQMTPGEAAIASRTLTARSMPIVRQTAADCHRSSGKTSTSVKTEPAVRFTGKTITTREGGRKGSWKSGRGRTS